MAKTLDRKKDFATIHGDSEARYFQDGTHFDAEGKELGAPAPAGGKKPKLDTAVQPAPVVTDVDQSPTKDPVDDMAA